MQRAKFVFAVVSATGGTAFNHGFHIGLLNILSTVVIDWYEDLMALRNWDLTGFFDVVIMGPFILAAFPLGGVLGSLMIWMCSTFCGRKLALLGTSGIVIITLILLCFAYSAQSHEVLIIGRVVLGVAAGVGSGITPMYLVEIAPDVIRGAVGSSYYVMMAGSIALAYIISFPGALGTDESWPFIFVVCFVPPCIQILTLVFCAESPKYLMFDREDEDDAEDALAWLQGNDIDEELEDLREEAAMLHEMGPIDLVRLMNDQTVRSPLIIATVILFGQQMCGAYGVLYFSTVIFKDLGYETDDAVNCTIGLGVCNFVAAILSMFLVDRVGRRPLLLGSFAGMVLSSLILAMVLLLTSFNEEIPSEVSHISVVFIYIYVLTYSVGAGTIPWFYAAEICNHFARASTMTLGMTANWIAHFIVAMSFLPLKVVTGNYIFLVFVIFDLLTLGFILMTMRETMDLTAIDITELFYD